MSENTNEICLNSFNDNDLKNMLDAIICTLEYESSIINDYKKEMFEFNFDSFKIQNPNKSRLDFIVYEIEVIQSHLEIKLKQREFLLSNIERFYEDKFDYYADILDNQVFVYKDLIDFLKDKYNLEFTFQSNIKQILHDDSQLAYNHIIFVNLKAEKIFSEYKNKYIIDPYTDYSFIFQQLKKEKLLYNITHIEFAEWLNDSKIINRNLFDKIISNKGFKALNKATSDIRLNNYYNITNSLS